MVGRPLTPDQARAFGLDRQVLQQTIAEAALDEEARRLGLGQSDEQIRQVIMNDPNFKGVGGTFDANRFQAMIRNFGYTEQRYVAEQRKVSLRRQITGTIGAGLEPPKTMIEAPVASPSRPSVRLTAFEKPVTHSQMTMMTSGIQSFGPKLWIVEM